MVSRTYGRGRPLHAPAAFIHPCQPILAKQPPSGPGWAHELAAKKYGSHNFFLIIESARHILELYGSAYRHALGQLSTSHGTF
jgi:hypothetical protein